MTGIENRLLLVFLRNQTRNQVSDNMLPCASHRKPLSQSYIHANKRILEAWRLILEIYNVIRAAQKRFAFVMAELREIEDYLEDY